MTSKSERLIFRVVRVLLTGAFLAAGLAKLAGVDMMVATYDAIGIGQWFRYLTGGIEVVAAILLWVPGWQFRAAAVLVATMIGAVLAHLLILGPSAMPALVLGLLAAATLWHFRAQARHGLTA